MDYFHKLFSVHFADFTLIFDFFCDCKEGKRIVTVVVTGFYRMGSNKNLFGQAKNKAFRFLKPEKFVFFLFFDSQFRKFKQQLFMPLLLKKDGCFYIWRDSFNT